MRIQFESQIRCVWVTALVSALVGPGCTGIIERSGSGQSGDVISAGGSSSGATHLSPQESACKGLPLQPKTAVIRRLSRNEYNNTVADLLFDTTSPATNLPPEVIGN